MRQGRSGIVGLGFVMLLGACAHPVPQDESTGRDGKIKGAVPIKLDNGEGVATGVVTYPGGDRVDWRQIDLPAGETGTLDLVMVYDTPRPGLRVAFDVFDQWNAPIAGSRAVRHRQRTETIDHAKGTYFVRVFAPRRGDAGHYKLKATFAAAHGDDLPTTTREVAEPPHLPAVPPPVEDCLTFDAHNPTCATECPDDAPSTWKGCKNTCRTPDVNNPACPHVMACPNPPDRRVDACMVNITKTWPACNQAAPDPQNPRCDVLDPVAARIINIEESGSDVTITIAAGSNQHVDKGWKVTLLQGNSNVPVVGGTTTILHVEKTKATARLHLRREIVEANQNLRLTPP